MISKKLLDSPELKSEIKKFLKEHKEIWDIAIYGSVIRGKTIIRDIDFAIIFYSKTKLDNKLSLAQKLKQTLSKIIPYEIDIKGIDFYDFFDNAFIARKAILAEGYLLSRKKYQAELFGFEAKYIFSYSLANLNHSKKIMFQYALKGRRGQKGLLEMKGCEQIGRGTISVPVWNSEEFREFLEKQNIKYKILKALIY